MITTRRKVLLPLLALVLSAAPGYAKTYSADRFDSVIRLLADGSLQVVETVVFRFEDGTFSRVFREIPHRRTDRIQVVSAAMDDEAFAVGSGDGHIEISGDSRTRVTWHFAPLANSTHTFELTYVVHGVVRQEPGADLLAWRALPTDHAYRIDSSSVSFVLPVAVSGEPEVELHRAASYAVTRDGSALRIDARGIRSNGWLEARLRFPPGSVIAAAPAWQQRERQATAAAPKWLVAAGVVFAACLVLLGALRMNYDAPPITATTTVTSPTVPDGLSPAIAGTLVANGRARLEQAMATLLSLADRGEIAIMERPRGTFGQRTFVLTRRARAGPLAEYEQRAAEIVFGGVDRMQESVALGKARARLLRRLRGFSRAMDRELIAAGLVDEARKSVRDRYVFAAVALLAAGILSALAVIPLLNHYGPWPMVIALAFVLAGLSAFIFFAAVTPLSNEGIRRASAWRAFRQYLKDLARERTPLVVESSAPLLPFAVALGLAHAWSRYLKHHPGNLPPWFQPLAADSGGFPAFIAAGGASAGSHGSGGGGGAAGGGASGAA